MSTATTPTTVNIRPGVTVLSVLRHLNYKPWFALAEFVDNALQSFMPKRAELGGDQAILAVEIALDPEPPGSLIVRDNAAGIEDAVYPRAFRPAEIPADRSGLSEFGMGMKSAACWFTPRWRVRTSALGEPTEKTVEFDISSIVRDSIEELSVHSRPAPPGLHFTEIVMEGLYRVPQGRTLGKVKNHLAGIYRMFTRDGSLRLTFNGELLIYSEPRILHAPHYADLSGPAVTWRKEIDFDLGGGLGVRGFAALRERASTSEAGFALFRRRRLIQGSADEGYRPEQIFGRPNSYRYQRLFGELELEGFAVTHTKDGFAWDENEETFLELLREHLDKEPLALLEQAEEYRALRARNEIQAAAEAATERTAHALEEHAGPVLQELEASPDRADPPGALAIAPLITRRQINVELNGVPWEIHLEMTNDPAVDEWLVISDTSALPGTPSQPIRRRLGLRVALSHPFMLRFAGSDAEQLEPLIRLGAAIGLSEVAARDSGVQMAGTFRRNVNELLRHALSES
ncbi:MAG TPA: ATP-binding protein [Candidatus Eisenbacteria bacterium]|jgi:hypothetical protein